MQNGLSKYVSRRSTFFTFSKFGAWSKAAVAALGIALVQPLQPYEASAAVMITVKGTVNSAALGYSEGQEVAFTFTINPDFVETTGSLFGPYLAWWQASLPGDVPLYSHLEGTGFTGNFDPDYGIISSSILNISSLGGMSLYLPTLISGYETPSGQSVIGVSLEVALNTQNEFSPPESYVDPSAFWLPYAGTYGVDSTSLFNLDAWNGFEIDTLVLTATEVIVIPEPHSVALLGFGAAGLAWRFRRGRDSRV